MAYNPFEPVDPPVMGLNALAQTPTQWRDAMQRVALTPETPDGAAPPARGLDALAQPSPTPSFFPSPATPFRAPESRRPDYDPLAAFEAKRAQLDQERQAVQARTAGDFEAGLKSGWEQTKGLGALAVSALGQKASELTDGAIGDGMQQWGYQKYQQTEKAAEPYREGRTTRVEDIDGVGSAIDWFQFTLGNVAPSIAESIGAGLIGAAVGSAATPAGSILGAVGGAAGKGAIRQALAKYATKQMVERGLTREAAEKFAGGAVGAGIGTFAAGYQMGLGDVYSETIDPETGKGNATSAMLLAIPYAGVEAITDMMLAGHILKGAAGADLIKRIPAAFAKGAAIEGGQEVAQESINILAGLNEGKEYRTDEVLSRLGNALAAGAIAGGVLGGAGGIRRDPNYDMVDGKPVERAQTDLLMDRALEGGPIPGWSDPQALRQAAHDPTLDDVSRARALSALEARLQARDPILGQMWREASIEALAGKRSVAETLAEIQARMAQTPVASSADTSQQEVPANAPRTPSAQEAFDFQAGPAPLTEAVRQGSLAGAVGVDAPPPVSGDANREQPVSLPAPGPAAPASESGSAGLPLASEPTQTPAAPDLTGVDAQAALDALNPTDEAVIEAERARELAAQAEYEAMQGGATAPQQEGQNDDTPFEDPWQAALHEQQGAPAPDATGTAGRGLGSDAPVSTADAAQPAGFEPTHVARDFQGLQLLEASPGVFVDENGEIYDGAVEPIGGQSGLDRAPEVSGASDAVPQTAMAGVELEAGATQGADRGGAVTPSAAPSKADEIEGIFGNIAQGMSEAAHENAVDRFKRDGAMTYRQPDAVQAAKSDPRYNTRDNPDGSVEVVGLLDPRTNEWVGQAPETTNATEPTPAQTAAPTVPGGVESSPSVSPSGDQASGDSPAAVKESLTAQPEPARVWDGQGEPAVGQILVGKNTMRRRVEAVERDEQGVVWVKHRPYGDSGPTIRSTLEKMQEWSRTEPAAAPDQSPVNDATDQGATESTPGQAATPAVTSMTRSERIANHKQVSLPDARVQIVGAPDVWVSNGLVMGKGKAATVEVRNESTNELRRVKTMDLRPAPTATADESSVVQPQPTGDQANGQEVQGQGRQKAAEVSEVIAPEQSGKRLTTKEEGRAAGQAWAQQGGVERVENAIPDPAMRNSSNEAKGGWVAGYRQWMKENPGPTADRKPERWESYKVAEHWLPERAGEFMVGEHRPGTDPSDPKNYDHLASFRIGSRGQAVSVKHNYESPSTTEPVNKAIARFIEQRRGEPDQAARDKLEVENDRARAAAQKSVFDAVLATEAVRNAARNDNGNLTIEIEAQIIKAVDRLVSETVDAGGPTMRAEVAALNALVSRNGKVLNPEVFTPEVMQAWTNEALKQARKAQREEQKQAHQAVIVTALAEAWNEYAGGTDQLADESARADFVTGFNHALDGGTRSNLPTIRVARAGYDAAQTWLQSEDGQAFAGGKKPRKMAGVGEQLRRRQDAVKRLQAIDIQQDADAEAFINQIFEQTERGTAFQPAGLARRGETEATPGAARYLTDVRNAILPFREWMSANGYGGRRKYYLSPETALRKKAGESVEERQKILKLATYYIDQLAAFAEVFENARTVAEAVDALEAWAWQEGEQGRATLTPIARQFEHGGMAWRDDAGGKSQSGERVAGLIRDRKSLNFFGRTALARYQRDEDKPTETKRNQPLTRPRFDRVEREGKDHRGGRDISAEELATTFNLRGVTYGESVTAKQRQDHTNYAFDAFMDLAEVLGIDPKHIGLGGRLAFAFGALGRGRHSAHYTPNNNGQGQAINLTNTRGDGAVAHEWLHALDWNLREPVAGGDASAQQGIIRDMIALLRYDIPSEDAIINGVRRFLVGGSKWTNMGRDAAPRDHAWLYLDRTIRDLTNVIERGVSGDKWTGATTTRFHRNATELGKDYWGNPAEEFARAGEAFVFDTLAGRNNYLVSDWVEDGHVTGSTHRGIPYPMGEERAFFNDAFQRLFEAIEFTEDGPRAKNATWDASPLRQKALDAIATARQLMADLNGLQAEEEAKKAAREQAQAEQRAKAQQAQDEAKARAAEEQAAKIRAEYEALQAQSGPKPPSGFGDLANLSDADLEALFDAAAAEQAEAAQELERGAPEPTEAADETAFVDNPVGPVVALADKLAARDWTTALSWQELFKLADEAFGGTRAQGAYSTKDAYDALEMALNKRIITPSKAGRNAGTGTLGESVNRNRQAFLSMLERLKDLDDRAPTQTNRTAEQDEFQQFSTPHTHAAVMARVANIDSQDVVLEPSAGSGNLATLAWAAGPRAVVMNELAPRRAAILRALGLGEVYTENAEHLNAILGPKGLKPTVIIMNPPFSASAGRLKGKRSNKVGAQHVAAALKLLAPGGRLVALMGDGYTRGNARVADHWKWVLQNFNVRANLGLDGEAYRKFGTTFDNRLVVIDHTGPTTNPDAILGGDKLSVEQAMEMLEGIRNDRIHVGERYGAQSQGERVAEVGSVPSAGSATAPAATGAVGTGESGAVGTDGQGARDAGGVSEPAGTGRGAQSKGRGARTGGRSGRRPAARTEQPGAGDRGRGTGDPGASVSEDRGAADPERTKGLSEIAAEAAKHGVKGIDEALGGLYELFGGSRIKSFPSGFDAEAYAKAKPHFQRAAQEFVAAGRSIQEFFAFLIQNFGAGIKPYAMQFMRELREQPIGPSIDPVERDETAPNEPVEAPPVTDEKPQALTDAVYDGYRADAYWATQGAQPHPGALVESAAMAAVKAPVLTARPKLPKAVITEGRLSDAQLDVVAYAQQAHEQMLPDGQTRRGFFIGDGTGLGKGREISGILYNNWLQGRKKAVWISVTPKLARDSREYLTAVTGSELGLFELSDVDANSAIESKEGVLFATYGTLISQGRGVKDATGKTIQEGQARLDQLVAWLGEDFDGVIAFDEAHAMGNAIESKGTRGAKKPSKTALTGVELQRRLPKARIVYASATGATEVSNLAYAERLGLWGEGTPFADKAAFIGNVTQGGVAAMEVVAKDLKALGVYQARSLSYDGVSYAQLEHALTDDQRAMYDVIAGAWQKVLTNIGAALEDTNGAQDGQVKGAALSAFWGAQQRFFNQMLTALQMPSVVASVKADLEAGRSVVLQIVNTNEAATERAAAQVAADGRTLEDLDITPRQTLMQYLENAFPVNQFETYTDEDGNEQVRLVTDSTGTPIQNPDAVAARDRLLDEIAAIRFPDGPMEILLNQFGADQVAEITGRKRRFVRVTDEAGLERMEEQKRSEAILAKEASEFQAGKRRILIFSDAGGTGLSYHADRTKRNQQKRVHYLLQPGWRADKAIQGLGRTHRTNQAQAPHVVLVTTDLRGHRRFVASIARRMDQLGALTKGQRQTGGQGIFTPEMNLESRWSDQAIEALIADVMSGKVPGITRAVFEEQMGLNLETKEGNRKTSSTPSVQQFLNRILALEVDLQTRVFDAFFDRLQQQIEAARAAGTLDLGMETIQALKIRKTADEVVYTHEATGAQTRLVDLELTYPVDRWAFDDLMTQSQTWADPILFFKRNRRSGKVYAFTKGPSQTQQSGRVIERFRRLGIKGRMGFDPVHEIGSVAEPGARVTYANPEADEKWETLELAEARAAWEAEYEATPTEETETIHILTGVLLPIWDRLGDFPVKVQRALTEDGEVVLGRLVPDSQLDKIQSNLTGTSRAAKLTPAEVLKTVLDQGATVRLVNNWRLERRRVGNEWRVELTGLREYREGELLRDQGVIYERISFTGRYFIPTGATGAEVLGRVMKNRPAAEVIGRDGAEDVRFNLADQRPAGDRLSRDFLQARLDAMTRTWPGLAQMPVKVVSGERGLPESVRAKLREMRANGTQAIPRAVYVPGDGLYFVASNIASVKEATLALAEEAIGHHGLRAVMGPQFDALLDRVADERLFEVMEMASQYGLDMEITEQRREAAEEYLAHQARLDGRDSWVQGIIQAIRQMLRKMGVRLRLSDGDIRELLSASRRYVTQGDARGALRARQRFGGQATGRNRDARFMFGGRKANDADLRSLVVALNRAKAGEDREAIRQETGWFQGDDGKWRFEINDDQAALKVGMTGDRVSDILPELGARPLGEILDHPALFAAYPDLASLPVRRDARKEGGSYDPEQRVLLLNARMYLDDPRGQDALSVLLHEIQHGIQYIEGFAVGGTPEQFAFDERMDQSSRQEASRRINEFERKVLDGRTLYEITEEAYDLAADEEITEAEARTQIDQANTKLEAAIAADPFYQNDLERARQPVLSANERYRRLAGEVEARNTQARQRLTAEQRRATPPSQTADVAADDVIVMFNGKEAASAPRPSNAGLNPVGAGASSLPATIDVDGVERPTTNSEGKPIYPTEEGVRNFWRWFGESKVVDDKGRPLVVYHGSGVDFSVFDGGRLGSNTGYGDAMVGFHFSDNAADADLYASMAAEKAGNESGFVRPFYLSLRNPLVVGIDEGDGNAGDMFQEFLDDKNAAHEFAKQNEMDGIVYLYGTNVDSGYTAIAFGQAQIKSADNNTGTFDPANPDIRFSLGGQTDFAEQNRRIRGEDKTLWERAKTQLKRQLAPGGLLPKSVFGLKIDRDSHFEAEEMDIRNLLAHFEDAVKAAYGKSFDSLDGDQKTVLGEALRFDSEALMDSAIPRPVRLEVLKMRQYIDRQSTEYAGILYQEAQDLLDRGQVEQAAQRAGLLNTIANNIGEYVHRSYRAFDDAKWVEKVPDAVINAARDYLTARYETKAAKLDAMADKAEARGEIDKADGHREKAALLRDAQRIDKEIRLILTEGTAFDSMESFIKEAKLGAMDMSVLKRRKDIAPEIRALLGEYTDPRLNFAKSATKMSRLIWNNRFLKRVLEAGEGVFLFKDKKAAPMDVTKQIASSKNYEPLAGYYTTPEIEQAFREILGKEDMADWYRVVVQANGLVKYGKTVLSPTTALRNWMSGYFFTVINGHFDVSKSKIGFKAWREYLHSRDQGRFYSYLRHLKELGVVYDTPFAGEMMRLLDDSNIEGKFDPETWSKVKNVTNFAQKFYGFGDDMWKIVGFENEKELLAKYKPHLSESEIEKQAAERIRNTYPTYSMTGTFIQKLRRFPLAGTFVSFPAEIIRTTANIIHYLREDFKDPAMRPLAIRRAVGLGLASGLTFAAQGLFMALLGVDDDEEEAFRKMAAPWQKNSQLLPIGRDDQGNLRFIDMSFLDPYNYFKRPIVALMRDEPIESALASAARDAFTPFFGMDIAAGAIVEILNNKKMTGGPVFNPQDTIVEQTADITNHLRRAIQPGIATNLERAIKAARGDVSPSGMKYSLADEALANLGFRVSTFNPRAALYYKAFEFNDDKGNANQILLKTLKNPNRLSDGDIESAFERAMYARRRTYEHMGDIAQGAMASGMSREEVMRTLRKSGISRADARALINGTVPKWAPGDGFMAGALRKSDAIYSPATRAEFERRRRQVMGLARGQ